MINLGKYYLSKGKILSTNSSNQEFIADLINSISTSILIKWRSSATRIPFFDEQFSRLQRIIAKLDPHSEDIESSETFEHSLKTLIQRNRFFKGVEIRIYLQPDNENPHSTNIQVLCLEYPDDRFYLNDRGLILAMAQPSQHPGFMDMLNISQNGFLSTSLKNQMIEREVDSLFFSNRNNKLLETTQSQIFLMKGSKIFTPDSPEINTWGIESAIKKAALELGLGFSKTSSIQIEHLNQADELFIANDFSGIRWVVGYEEKRFFKKYSPQIVNLINRDWESSS